MNLSMAFTESTLLQLIENKVEEGQDIDYKSSLTFTPQSNKKGEQKDWKFDLCVDVSAFANSSGGAIVFGIDERRDSNSGRQPKVFPTRIDDGIDPSVITKEQIIQVLHEGIQRPVIFVLDVVDLKSRPGKLAFVVRIPQSLNGPHQVVKNKDYRYYQRYETQNVIMQDWQIRDVANRRSGPDLGISFALDDFDGKGWNSTDDYLKRFSFQMPIVNLSPNAATHILLNLFVDQRLIFRYGDNRPQISDKKKILPNGKLASTFSYQLTPSFPLLDASLSFHWNSMNFFESTMWMEFKQDPMFVQPFEYDIEWQLFAPNMTQRRGLERIIYSNYDLQHTSLALEGLEC